MHIRDILSCRPALSLTLGLGLGLAGLTGPVSAVRAQAPTPAATPEKKSPVEAVEQALKIGERLTGTAEANQAELAKRRQALQQAVNQISTFGEAAQVLNLIGWKDYDTDGKPVDLDIRRGLLERFKRGVREIVERGDSTSRAALATLVGEFSANARSGLTLSPNSLVELSFTDFARGLREVVRRDSDPRVREAAARALGKVRAAPEETGPALETILRDRSSPVIVRRTAAEALASLVTPTSQAERSGSSRAVASPITERDIIEFGKEIARVALVGLGDSDPVVRRLSITALEQVSLGLANALRISSGGGLLESPIAPLPADAEFAKKMEATLGELLRTAPAVSERLVDPDAGVRRLAARALEEIGVAQQRWLVRKEMGPVPIPEDLKPDAKGERKRAALPPGELLLVAAPAAPEPEGRAGLIATIDNLLIALADPDVRVRLAAVDALDAITTRINEPAPQKDLSSDQLLRIGKGLARALGDRDRFVRWASARTLGRLGPIEGVKGAAVAGLVRMLVDPDHDARAAAALALERYGPAAAPAVPALTRAVNEGDTDVRTGSIQALVAIGKEAAPAVPAIAQALSDPNPRIRRAAAEALSRLSVRVDAAVEALQKALNDPDPDVRHFASDALLKDRPLPGLPK